MLYDRKVNPHAYPSTRISACCIIPAAHLQKTTNPSGLSRISYPKLSSRDTWHIGADPDGVRLNTNPVGGKT
jgi:hypothetical protein